MFRKKMMLEIRCKKGQQPTPREVGLINSGAVEGVLRVEVKSKGNSVSLSFNTDGLIELQEFIQMNEMNKKMFVILLRNIVIALKSIEKNKLSNDLISFKFCTSYIDPSSWHVYLMYVPIQPYESEGNLKTYLQQIVSSCNFSSFDNITYAQVLINELNENIMYTVGKLEDYCNRVSEELSLEHAKCRKDILCSVCGAKLEKEETICPFCGSKVRKDHIKKVEINGNVSPEALDQGAFFVEESNRSAQEISINEDENGVVTVFRSSKKNTYSVWIEDCEYAGKISVSKFPFRIGKMDGVSDYRIYSNTVSRKHADILREQGKYFIVDLGSTNGTFMKGKRLQPGVKEELYDGSVFVLADSKFKFHID